MEKFTASNGVKIDQIAANGITGGLELKPVWGKNTFVFEEELLALREFFQHERDEELGRWRWPENPNWVIYRKSDDEVTVLDELDPEEGGYTVYREDEEIWPEFQPAARAYFAAHPEPKSWHDAQEGEVWLITSSNPSRSERLCEFPAIFQADRFRDHGGSWGVRDIVAARRIWPEEEK